MTPDERRAQRREYDRAYRQQNREHRRELDAAYRRAHPDQLRQRYREAYYRRRDQPGFREKARMRHLRWKYGLSVASYDELFAQQNGVCALCGNPETATYKGLVKKLAIDHEHSTKRIRGLLCQHCNTLLRRTLETPDWIVRAYAYLAKR